jgi:hypothetical protein
VRQLEYLVTVLDFAFVRNETRRDARLAILPPPAQTKLPMFRIVQQGLSGYRQAKLATSALPS